MDWMLLPLKRYAEFSGRSRRMEFWMWVLFTVIVGFVLGLIDGMLGLKTSSTSVTPGGMAAMSSVGVLGGIWSLGTLVPSIAVGVRRLHDTDRSGWWILLPAGPYLVGLVMLVMGMLSGSLAMAGLAGVLMLIGMICAIVLLVFYCLPGTVGPNKYGADPMGGAANLSDTFA
ncbi:DUF805 domain-containing protein [Sphingomonas panacisoli]|uniref:DUF805 domain-containing protein n=1 Tax=Sphingomonas panacisoli TaxID=1813879 RepID=A0A5B8LHQ1_9SPHN|nr:DUF805 domain-containing protein [Sphingomonas panacisoli]QDZ07142.1 DUF805 domain-containing protein [Sphingomonas panacisoli]